MYGSSALLVDFHRVIGENDSSIYQRYYFAWNLLDPPSVYEWYEAMYYLYWERTLLAKA